MIILRYDFCIKFNIKFIFFVRLLKINGIKEKKILVIIEEVFEFIFIGICLKGLMYVYILYNFNCF